MIDEAAGFDATYAAIAHSSVYRAAAHELTKPLPTWVVPRSSVTAEDAYRFVAIPMDAGETILDLGCGLGGPGMWIAHCQGARLIGIDRSPAGITAARELAATLRLPSPSEFRVASGEATGLPGASVAQAISINAIMFIPAAAVALEMARVLRPRGFFAFIATEWSCDEDPPLTTIERDYQPILEAAGFRVHDRMQLDAQRGLPLFRALLDREDALVAEVGEAAQALLAEARAEIAAATQPPRTRHVFYIARRP